MADALLTQNAYDKWCGLNNFESKLPKVVQERKDAALAADRAKQQSLDPHLTKELPQERVIPYSDDLFRDAAVQWLVETHQVYSLLTFQERADKVSCKAHSGPRAPDLQGNDCCSRTFQTR